MFPQIDCIKKLLLCSVFSSTATDGKALKGKFDL